ncbi:hypothetical protein DXT91_17265 [Agrobacterium tumefaciens]|nr:hypothetical protein DXM26_05400 [Agrobacterium tumefaciens]KAA3529074.1 hypothetical protein DXM29_09795 [Agrobacterium tumefaciens]MQB05861.1 hypothetical protein [Agrobacterium tumefaciens]
MQLRHAGRRNENSTVSRGNRAVSKPVIHEKCLWAAKNVRQCEKCGKACKRAQGDGPTGFLSGFFHDYSSYSLSGRSSRPGPLGEAFIKIRRRTQMQKAAK